MLGPVAALGSARALRNYGVRVACGHYYSLLLPCGHRFPCHGLKDLDIVRRRQLMTASRTRQFP
jgi:hypothetical protein